MWLIINFLDVRLDSESHAHLSTWHVTCHVMWHKVVNPFLTTTLIFAAVVNLFCATQYQSLNQR